ncbi:MAG: hypothetical protein H6815_01945 [Phycisphaeraceae bacterium]|nr:hypothetical protein [Phycisphaerales bacterium]MCB9859191.1 hypothetical protein [Phycisphaeraceae bacterium]
MHAKLVVLIVSIACGALTLLVARHLRLQADHEMAAARLRILSLDATLWDLRAEIAANVTPERIDELSKRFGELAPIVPEPEPEYDAELIDFVLPSIDHADAPIFHQIDFSQPDDAQPEGGH